MKDYTTMSLEELTKERNNMIGFNPEDEKECLEAVKQNGFALQFIKNQTPEICLEAIKQDGDALQYVEEQTEEICLAAVKENGISLRYVKEQTPEICLEAVKNDGFTLQYVKEQTPEICLEAVKNDGFTLQYVKEQTPEICLEALKRNGFTLQYVEDLSTIFVQNQLDQTKQLNLYKFAGKTSNSGVDIEVFTFAYSVESAIANVNEQIDTDSIYAICEIPHVEGSVFF